MTFGKINVNDNVNVELNKGTEVDEVQDRYNHPYKAEILKTIYAVSGRPANLRLARVAHLWADRFQVDFFCEVEPDQDDGTGFGLKNKLVNYGIVPHLQIVQHHFLRFDGSKILTCDPVLPVK